MPFRDLKCDKTVKKSKGIVSTKLMMITLG